MKMATKQKSTEQAKAPATKAPTSNGSIAAIRLRSSCRINVNIETTLKNLNLRNQHNLVILPNKPNTIGMLTKAKDYMTWGEISEEMKKEVEAKVKGKVKENVFRLHPPKGGFGRKGIKYPFSMGGALGYKGEKINDLIKKMIG